MRITTSTITIRPPTFSRAEPPRGYQSPNVAWITGTWHVTHSSLPMWRKKRNVRIQYVPLEPSVPSLPMENTDRIDDVVSSQSLFSGKISYVRGIDKYVGRDKHRVDERGEWKWRGRGLLWLITSSWDILGWGEEEETGNKWMVTMFAPTLFTPAGIDVYSQDSIGLRMKTVTAIRHALRKTQDEAVFKLAGQLFEIRVDDAREL